MSIEIMTRADWQLFKTELLQEIKALANQKTEPRKWLKSEEVRKLLKISSGTLQTLRINGTLEYSRIGNIIYYDAEHLNKILEANKVKAFK
jgi:hypothetical protein